MSTNQDRAAQDIRDVAKDARDSLADELTALRGKVETLMEERVTPTVSKLVGQAEAAATSARDGITNQATRLVDTVRERPMTALAIAAAALVALFALAMLNLAGYLALAAPFTPAAAAGLVALGDAALACCCSPVRVPARRIA